MANRGPCRINMSHLPEAKIKELEDILFHTERPAMQRFFQGRGVDFRSGEIELWPTDCYLCGGHGLTGLVVNDRAECSIPGLYAAGDTSLVARGHLSGALVFGMIGAEQASAFAERAPKPVLEMDQVEAVIADQKAKLSQDKNPIPIEEFEFKVCRLINDYIRPPQERLQAETGIVVGRSFSRGNSKHGSRAEHARSVQDGVSGTSAPISPSEMTPTGSSTSFSSEARTRGSRRLLIARSARWRCPNDRQQQSTRSSLGQHQDRQE